MTLPKVLIIDDSITDCLLMTNALQQAGYEVRVATDGREGLTALLADPPQCLILDLILPGINGYTICRQVRARDPGHIVPIVIVSAKSSALDQNYALSLGADRYLAKPFTEEMLLQAVWELLPTSIRASITQTEQHTGPITTPEKYTQPDVHTLIPYRSHEEDLLWVSSPFSSSAVISNKVVRRLYAAIDGHKTVSELARITQLDLPETLRLLKTLWDQRRIAFTDQEGHPLEQLPSLVIE